MYNNNDTNTRVYLIYCDIGIYRHWVRESTDPKKFFSNFSRLKLALEELSMIEYDYQPPSPNEELTELISNSQQYIQDFIKRSFAAAFDSAQKLKTKSGRAKRYTAYFDELKKYEYLFSDETLNLISALQNDPHGNVQPKVQKSEKDTVFLSSMNEFLDTQNDIMEHIGSTEGKFAWFYNNSKMLSALMERTISHDIIYDITRLLLVCDSNEKASKYLALKYDLHRTYAQKLYLAAARMTWAYKDFMELRSRHPDGQYFISTHSYPCEKCQRYRGKIFKVAEAVIGNNFPPFCRRGCSKALWYIDLVSLPKPLSEAEILFAKAKNLYDDELYEEAADHGLRLYNVAPESDYYTETVAEMLYKAGQIEDAVRILEDHVEKYQPSAPKLYELIEKYSKKI